VIGAAEVFMMPMSADMALDFSQKEVKN